MAVGISPAACSCSSVTPACCIRARINFSISTIGDTSSAFSGFCVCNACIANHAPMLTPYTRICFHTGCIRA